MITKKGGNDIRLLMVGDVVGKPGRELCSRLLPELRQKHDIDGIILNGENSTNCGRGLNEKCANEFFKAGVDIITTGNHIWRYPDFFPYLDKSDKVVRPANFPTSCPGKGYAFMEIRGVTIAVLNIMGRVFFRENLDCPFKVAESKLLHLASKAKMVFVDFHADATSEKEAMGFFLDGKVTGVVGTHTHIQTADERILPKGTAYLTDLGRTGPLNSCLGVKKETVIQTFLTQMPARFSVEDSGPQVLSGALIDADVITGKATNIQRLYVTSNS